MILSKSVRNLLFSLIVYSQASHQYNLGARAEVQLDHGMSVITYFTQETADDVAYEIWFNNPTNFPYWENSLCLVVIAGTPALKDPSTERCSFLPVFDEGGNKNPYETSGENCIQEQITINPCRDKIQLNTKADCGGKLNLLPQYYFLDDTRHTGLTMLTTKKYRKTWLDPDHNDSIYRQSMLISYTDRNNSMAEWGQLLKCQDINLGYGPLNDFTFYPIKNDHTYDTSKFLSEAALVKIDMSIILSTVVFALIKYFAH
ncbi:hypothetical protein MAM1_0157c06828 [Mucor ambiguus]|uniref:Uncharacterized protein n=1 Tax=Mucor ambiguus TaxID=91626 RepID=A0A0C9MV52_9FUNG|nr:hypothetical protein MAM1_0157c06828 [Mucor ambiguus]